MPSSQEILGTLTTMAQEWQWLAVVWHVYVVVLGVSFALGWRPLRRVVGFLLLAPVTSVAVLAGMAGNPFTAVVVGKSVIGAFVLAMRSSFGHVVIAPLPFTIAGIVLIVFGLCYPHFLEPASFFSYMYSAPVGIVPCPTLAITIGFSILLNGLTRAWCWLFGILGLFYGAYGAIVLGVTMDWALAAGALALILLSGTRHQSVSGAS